MKAVVYDRYGGPEVLRYQDFPKPIPDGDRVLVRIHATAVNAGDWRLMRASPFIARMATGLFRPKFPILGSDIAGTVEQVGPDVTRFAPGDQVFGDVAQFGLGGFAEYACPSQNALVRKPANVGFDMAAASSMAGMTAIQGLRDHGRVQPGQKVLIVGSSGGVGTFSVQYAKLLGAEVTAVCSASKAETARKLGADHVIDYASGNFLSGTDRYDVIFAVNGDYSIHDYRRCLVDGGRYLMTGGGSRQIRQSLTWGPVLSLFGRCHMGPAAMSARLPDLQYLAELLESHEITPVIDRRYPLHEVPEAIRYLEQGHAAGKVIIDIGSD